MSTTTAHKPRLAVSPATVRLLLKVDAAACGLLGLVAVVAAGTLNRPLDAPTPLLVVGGLVLLIYAAQAAYSSHAGRRAAGCSRSPASTAPSLSVASLPLPRRRCPAQA